MRVGRHLSWLAPFLARNDHPIGVDYDPGQSRWTIRNPDLESMPEGVRFNVTVFDPPFFSDGFESGNTSAWSNVVP